MRREDDEVEEGVDVVWGCGCGCMCRCDEMASASVESEEDADDGVTVAEDGSEIEGRRVMPAEWSGEDPDDVEADGDEVEVGDIAAACELLSLRGLGTTGTDDAAAASCW
jgi:hypothetical protein